MLKSFKYRLLPTGEQKIKLENYFGCCRFVYNLGLETKISAYTLGKKNITCFDLIRQLKELKDNEAGWLSEVPSQTLQMSLRNLDNSYANFFRGAGFPRFKRKNSKQSIQFPQGVSIDPINNKIFIPKLKNIDIILHRNFSGSIKTTTISKTSYNAYFVSIIVDTDEIIPKKSGIHRDTTVGVDMGIKTFATLSDGVTFENIRTLKNSIIRLKAEQRKLDRKRKNGGSNYTKQKIILARLHAKIANQREDYINKVSTSIIKNYDTICLENLNIKGMMKNHKLSLAIGEIGWNSFESKLIYKSEWYGKNIIYIGRFEPSSKMCSKCGKINNTLKLSDRLWTCKNCNKYHDRDINAAINIKNFGLRDKPLLNNASH